MNFYNNFASIHDVMLSIDDRLKFNKKIYQYFIKKFNIDNVIDCACGTGVHAILLKQLGLKIIGTDISIGMINKAIENTSKKNLDIKYKILDFQKLSQTFGNNIFNGVLCVGNSLPHIFKEKDIINSLQNMYNVLKKGGVLILNQRNYDLMLKKKKRFGIINKTKQLFCYVYDYEKSKIKFNIIVIDKNNNNNSDYKIFKTEYNPISINKLTRLAKQVGFKEIKLYDCDKKKFEFNIDKSDYYYMTLVK